MLRIFGSAVIGGMIGAVSGVALIALFGGISGIESFIQHPDEGNGPIAMFLTEAIGLGVYIGIPLGAPVGAVVGLLIGAVIGSDRASRGVKGAKPIPDELS